MRGYSVKTTVADNPCPIPPGFKEAPPLKEKSDSVPDAPAYWPVGSKGGHLEDATGTVYDSIWGVPDGRRKE